jgi:hypothetical protein
MQKGVFYSKQGVSRILIYEAGQGSDENCEFQLQKHFFSQKGEHSKSDFFQG